MERPDAGIGSEPADAVYCTTQHALGSFVRWSWGPAKEDEEATPRVCLVNILSFSELGIHPSCQLVLLKEEVGPHAERQSQGQDDSQDVMERDSKMEPRC